MNINLCNRNLDILNCSLLYRFFVCSYLKASAKHSQVFVDSRGTKFYSRKVCQQVFIREIDFLLGKFFPLLNRGLLFDLCIKSFEVYVITFLDVPQPVCKPSVFFANTSRLYHGICILDTHNQ